MDDEEPPYSGPYHPRLTPIDWLRWSDDAWSFREHGAMDLWTPEDVTAPIPGGVGRLGDATILLRGAKDRTLWSCKVCGSLWTRPADCHGQKSKLEPGERFVVAVQLYFDGFEKIMTFEVSGKYPPTERATNLAREIVALHQIVLHPRPWIQLPEEVIEALRPIERPEWPEHLRWVVERIATLKPEELPKPPWVLHTSPTKPINGSLFFGGPAVTVANNETYLTGLRQDVAAGPHGPKRHVIEGDLLAFARVLRQHEPQRAYCF